MLLLSAFLVAASGASSGPDLGERAVAVDLPIAEVVVFSDRARVTRRGKVKLTGGAQAIRAPDLPGVVMIDSVRVSATNTTVVRVETQPVERERWSIDQVDAWLKQLEDLGDKIAIQHGKLAAAQQELALLQGITVSPPVLEKDRLGKPLPAPATDMWKDAQDRLAARRNQARVVERAAERELRALAKEYERVQREVQARDIGGFTDQKIEALLIVEGGAGEGVVVVEYAVPGAFWKPAYDLYFDPDAGKVELKAQGMVSQATGEDWPNVKLALSTAIPGQGIDMPQLRTWTLGDDREYVPAPSARSSPRTTRPFQPPVAKPRIAEMEKEADRALLQERAALLVSMASTPLDPGLIEGGLGLEGVGSGGGGVGVGYGSGSGSLGTRGSASGGKGSGRTTIDFSDATVEGDLAKPDGSYTESRSRVSRRPAVKAPPPAPAMAPPEEPYDMPAPSADYDEDDGESVVGSALQLVTGITSSKKESVRTKSLALQGGGIRWRRQTFSDPALPAMSAGGFDYVYDAPLAVTVPSQAQDLRVPLAAKSYDVSTFYEATPSLATTAYLKATVKNGSKLPILQGPANVFVKRTFAGDATLATTGPGGALELPLGADEDIRLTRTVIPATKTQGLFFGEEDVTDYAVKIEIGNYKKRAITIRVVDQLPKTNAEKIKTEMVVVSPKPQEKPDADGLLYWHVDVPAGGTKTITFTYRITRPKNWKLYQ